MPFEIISRAEAKAKGLKSYFTDKPCLRGHIDLRSVTGCECYECRRIRNREWHQENPDLATERRERFVENNPGYFQDYSKRKPEVRRAAKRRWRKKHPQKHVAENALYQRRHPEKVRAQRKKRRRESPAVAIRLNMASRLAMAIRNALGQKSASTMKLVGCEIDQLMAHLESKFQSGMNWDNYGLGHDRWHCDHIRPCSAYDLKNPAQQRACFHFSNLQPLWQPDNLRKGARIDASTATV